MNMNAKKLEMSEQITTNMNTTTNTNAKNNNKWLDINEC